MADPTLEESLRRNPPQQTGQRLRDALRRHPPTPIGSLAATGGPGQEAALEGAQAQQMGRTQSQSDIAGLIEGGAAFAAGAMPGGLVASRLASGMVSRLGMLGAQILGRGAPAAAAGLAVSEGLAPAGETPQQSRQRQALSVASSVGGEAAGPLIQAGIVRPILTPIRARLGGLGAKELLELGSEEAQALMRSMGTTLTPGQIRTGKLLDTLENLISSTFGGSQIMAVHKQRALGQAVASVDQTVYDFAKGLTSEDASLMLRGALDGNLKLDRAATRAAYEDVTSRIIQAGGVGEQVAIEPVFNAAIQRLGTNPKDVGALKVIDSVSRFRTPRVSPDLPSGKITFEQAEQLRGDLLAIGRSGQDVLPSVKILANELAEKVDQSITAAGLGLGRYGPQVVASLHGARALSRATHERFEHGLIAGLIENVKPERLYAEVLADDNPSQLRMIRKVLMDPSYRVPQKTVTGEIIPAIKDPEGIWNGLRTTWITEKKRLAGEKGATTLDGKALLASIDDAKGTARELFSDRELFNLRRSARAIELIQSSTATKGIGSLAIQLTQFGAATTAGGMILNFGDTTSGAAAGAGFILLAPVAVALALTNPRFATHMMNLAKTSKARVGSLPSRAAAQTISHLTAARIPFLWKGRDGQTIPFDPATAQDPVQNKPESKF